MIKKLFLLCCLTLIFYTSFGQNKDTIFKLIVSDTPKLWKVDKRSNRQVLTWKSDHIPFIIAGYPLAYPMIDNPDLLNDLPKQIPRNKVTPFYFYGSEIEFQAFDSLNPNKSALTNKKSKIFNYFHDRKQYFRIFNHKYQDVSTSSFSNIMATESLLKRLYHEESRILGTTLKLDDFLLVNFYDQKTDTLLRSYYLKRIKKVPKLERAWTKSIGASSLEQPINEQSKLFTIYNDQQLILEFDKSKFLKDSIIQYQLSAVNSIDTAWHTTDRFLTLSNLESKTTYSLKLRYNFQKESIVAYKIQTGPNWYQTITFYAILCISCILLLTLIISLIAKYKIKLVQKKQQHLQQEIRSIQNQLNPHFTFNALSSIQGLINTKKYEDANRYLTEFSSLLRATLANSHQVYLPLNKEIPLLETYLRLEQLRFGFHYQVIVDSTINQNEMDIPNFLLQPLIENAVKHGVSALGEKGTIEILFQRINTNLLVTITDNGKGFDGNPDNTGYGMLFVKEKLKLLNYLLKAEVIKLSFIKRNGTVIEILFNNWLI